MNSDTINSISKNIIAACDKNLVSLYSYGSALTSYFSALSDYDFLVILKDAHQIQLELLKNIVQEYHNRGVSIDINVQTEDEMPSIRGNAFWHNNRGLYIQSEIRMYGKLLYGKEQFRLPKSFNKKALQLEALRVANSLVYQTRKSFINRSQDDMEKYKILKFCIYAAIYALAAKGIFPEKHSDIIDLFLREFPGLDNPNKFLNAKKSDIKSVSMDTIHEAYNFLKKIDIELYNIYKDN